MSIIIFFVIFFLLILGLDLSFRAPGYIGPVSDHFNGTHFKNIMESAITADTKTSRIVKSLSFLVKWVGKLLVQNAEHRWHKRSLPYEPAVPQARVSDDTIVTTFINHSTVLIQTAGINILTDPIWSHRASPLQFFGPRRFMPPGVQLSHLPTIDIILQSHNHYDHLDITALKWITERDTPHIFTPLGNTSYLTGCGIGGAYDMDWGEKHAFSDTVSITCVPAQHFSGRGLSDRNKTLWAGFVISTQKGDIYFAGDTGYGPAVPRIKKMYPQGFRLAFLPLGTFEPRWFMRSIHESPDEAVMMYKDLHIKEAIGIHLGTFDLGLDGQDEPKEKIKKLLTEPENKNIKFTVLENGESLKID